ncbi:MAG: DNA polymerase III subunit alpha [Deltaproteobacteria bacterium]|nr:MAG: DNA polymerase III subunit alpha [Deltaproteobacteria bacterium]
MPAEFAHLHLHTLYSLLDGAIRLPDLMRSCEETGMKAVAVTDHGNMFGVVNFYQEAKKHGIKPIIGFEAYVAGEKGMGDKSQRVGNHLVLLAQNETGYRNLRYLSTKAFTDGFYYDPRVDKPLLKAHSEGLIALTACMAGAVPRAVRRGDMDEARREVRDLKSIFGDRLYLEIQSNALKEQLPVNHGMCELAREEGLPLVATADSHYVKREDAKAHEVLMAIASGRTFDDPKRLRHDTEELYIKSPGEMSAALEATTGVGAEWQEAVHNSWVIAEQCNVDLSFKDKYLPKFQVPDGETLDSYLQTRAREGLDERFAEIARTGRRIDADLYRERLERELAVIVNMKFSGYFLIVQDFINWAKRNGIPVGPGRGSGAGSLVAYSLRVTDIDPIPYHLLFERFLNPERVSMPDFDIDFCQDRRGEVIDYVTAKYGKENVAQIITYGALSAKSAIKDVARVMGVPFAEVNELTRNIPNLIEGHPATIEKALEVEPKLRQIQEQKPVFKAIIEYARALEGLTRSTGMHAAGVVIGEKPLWEYVPLCRGQNGELVTQFAKDEVELAGLVKFDFLGLTTLTVISNAVKLINRGKKPEEQLDIALLPLDDKKTYQLISSGDTAGIFQMESSGFTEMVKKLKPSVFEDIIAAGALYRPGPLDSGMVDVFINRKHGRERVAYLHPLLEPILKDTYGVIVYQEQVMQIAQELAGYSLGRADLLRRAMGKKKAEVMAQERGGFLAGCKVRGVAERVANEIFDLMEKFAEYGFNKCIVGSARICDAISGRRTTVRELFEHSRPFHIHALGDDGRLRPRRVVDVVSNGGKPVFEIRTALGHRIVATANHPLRVLSGWKQLGELRVGEHIAAPRYLRTEAAERWPRHELICLAGLLSEGNTCHPTSLYFYNNRESLIDDFARAASQFPDSVARVYTRANNGIVVCVTTGRRGAPRRIEGNAALAARPVRSGAFEWAQSLGILGLTATEKKVPECVFGAGNNHVPFYATSSEQLAKDVQALLLRLGIPSGVHRKLFKYRGSERPGWTVHVIGDGSSERFLARVAPHCIGREVQVQQLRNYVASVARETSKDTIPSEVRRWVAEARRERGWTWSELERKSGLCARALTGNGSAVKRGFRRSTIAQLAQTLESKRLAELAASDIFWDRIVSVEPRGEQETFDLTVEGDHNFVADGLIVHNSHSAAYGLITCQTAFLKAHHPVEFMAALLTSEKDNTDKVVAHIAEARADGITVLPPDVNESDLAFGVGPDPKNPGRFLIRFGLGAIRGVGENAIEAILAARNKPFVGLFDFCARIDTRKINKKVVEALVTAGAFDFTGKPRRALFECIEAALQQGASAQKDRESGQFGLFGGGAKAADGPPEERVFGKEEWSERERLALEKQALGFYITGHPLARYAEDVKRFATHTCSSLATARGFEKVAVAGIVQGWRERLTKTGKKIAFAMLEDLTGARDLVIYEDIVQKYESLLKADEPVLVRGVVRMAEKFGNEAQQQDAAEPSPEIKVDEVSRLTDVRAAKATRVELKLSAEQATSEKLAELKSLFGKFPGSCATSLSIVLPGASETKIAIKSLRVAPSDDLLAAVDRLFGGKVAQVR